jgi:ATP-dependent RNA helicase DDX46/PRP5
MYETLITQAKTIEARKQAERLARLQAWKEKQAADREAKMKDAAASGGVKILQDMDKKAMGSPLATSSPGSPQVDSGANSPVLYAGKFDPKAIIKKASAKSASQIALGIDAATLAPGNSASSNVMAATTNKPKVGLISSSSGMLTISLDHLDC